MKPQELSAEGFTIERPEAVLFGHHREEGPVVLVKEGGHWMKLDLDEAEFAE